MPIVFQLKCEACDYKGSEFSDYCLALIVDEGQTARLGDIDLVHPHDNRLIVLPHPCESSVVKKLDVTLEEAAWSGRIVTLKTVICEACGAVYETRRVSARCLSSSRYAKWFYIMPGFIGGVLVGWWQESIWIGFVSALLVMFVVSISFGSMIDRTLERKVRSRYAGHIARFDRGPGCPECGSKQCIEPQSHVRRLPCPRCRRRMVRIDFIGIS